MLNLNLYIKLDLYIIMCFNINSVVVFQLNFLCLFKFMLVQLYSCSYAYKKWSAFSLPVDIHALKLLLT